MLKIIILLTAFVGFVVPTLAQVDSTLTPPVRDSVYSTSDSLSHPSDSLAGPGAHSPFNKLRLSTDSVYSTSVPESDGILPSSVEYTASDSIVGDISLGEAYLYRDAFVKYKDLSIKAGYIKIDFNKSEVYAIGIKDTAGNMIQKPVFTENGKSYRADEMRYNFKSKKAKIKKVITQEGEGFLHGEEVKKVNAKVFYVKNASYTTCSHEHPHFEIKTPKAKVIAGEKIVTKFAYLEILDVPTPLMIPFGFFPTTETRQSGIILPSYGKNEYRGYFLSGGGYYWAINDYLDLTLTSDIYTQGGYGVKASTTYRKRYKYSGNLSLSYNRIKYGEEAFAEYANEFFKNQSDYAITWSHSQDAKARPDFRFNGSVNIASANYYKVTSTAAEDVLQNRLNSSISITKTFTGKPYNLTASINHSQNNQTKDLTLTLPEATFAVNRLFPFKPKVRVGEKKWYEEIGFSYTVTGKNEIQSKLGKPLFTQTVFQDSSRNGLQHRIPISANYKVFKNFVLNPQLNYSERWYFQRSEWGYVDSLNRAMVVDTSNGFYGVRDFSANANLSTTLYGLWRYKGFVRAIRHKMTPAIGFTYQPDFSTDFWGYYQNVQVDSTGTYDRKNRYNYGIYGSPNEGVQGNITFRIDNTLEAKVRDKQDSLGLKKIKLLERFSVNTAYNVAARKYKWQLISLTMGSSIFKGLVQLNYRSTFDLYGYDEGKDESGRVIGRVNDYAINVNHKLLRIQNQNLSLSMGLSADRLKNIFSNDNKNNTEEVDKKKGVIDELPDPNPLGITDGDIDYYRRRGFVDFTVPWSINLNYNLTKTYTGSSSNVTQSADVSGDFELTQNWRVGFSTGYDLVAKDFTYTSFDFYRDLHCWELRCSWIPFGFQQSYTLTIRVKASTLSDLKLERRRGIGDFQR